jgi:RHS repeat-associated protein
MDRLFTRKDALNRQEGYHYDPFGNLTQFTDRKNQQSTFTYDNLNRRASASYQDGSSTSFVYDAVGRLTRATDSTSSAIDFFYDNLDRLILEVTPQGAVAYEYDAIGRRTKMTVAGQAPVTYQYDAASRLTQVAQGSLVVGMGYDAAGRRTSLTYPNGTSTTYTYDNASRLTNITHNGPSGIIEALTYQYDAAGNRTSLTRANGTASLLPSAVASASYDAANEQTQFSGVTLTYDQNGNLTSDGVNTYTWDARNRLTSISGGTTANFQYDPLGRRISKTIGGVTSQFLYDGNDIAQEIQGSAVTASYLRSLDIDESFVRQTNLGNDYYHLDVLKSSLTLSNAAGSPTTTYSYEPFGNTVTSGSSLNAVQFTGREHDGTDLYFARSRFYSATRHRFLAEDPIRFHAAVNFYAYVDNDPLGFTDPYGLEKKKGCAAGGQSTTVTGMSITIGQNGPQLNVQLKATGFPLDSEIYVETYTGSLRSDQNPAGPNRVDFIRYRTSTPGKVDANGRASVSVPLNGLLPGQYLQIIPPRLAQPFAPVVTPQVGRPGDVRPTRNLEPQTNYDSPCL